MFWAFQHSADKVTEYVYENVVWDIQSVCISLISEAVNFTMCKKLSTLNESKIYNSTSLISKFYHNYCPSGSSLFLWFVLLHSGKYWPGLGLVRFRDFRNISIVIGWNLPSITQPFTTLPDYQHFLLLIALSNFKRQKCTEATEALRDHTNWNVSYPITIW